MAATAVVLQFDSFRLGGGVHPSPSFNFTSHCGPDKPKTQIKGTGPLALPFTHLLAPLTHSLTAHYSLHLRAPLRSLVRSLTHFTHSLMGQWMVGWLFILGFFLSWTIVHHWRCCCSFFPIHPAGMRTAFHSNVHSVASLGDWRRFSWQRNLVIPSKDASSSSSSAASPR